MSAMGDTNLEGFGENEPKQTEVAESVGEFKCKSYSPFSNCSEEIVGTCLICKQPFCSEHQSEADSESCNTCTSYQTIELKKDPLIDDDGIAHEGAKITPIGLSYRTLTTRISEMPDHELELHIDHVRRQVREAETVLDYRRIDLAASQVEFEERGMAKRKNLRMRSVSQLANGSKVIGGPQSGSDKAKEKALQDVGKKLQMIAKLFGLPCSTPAELAIVAMKLQALNKVGGKK